MKIIKISALFLILVISSCKKDYECVCTNSYGSYNAGTVNASKSDAKKYCKSLSSGSTSCGL